jgi:hypothetical protein
LLALNPSRQVEVRVKITRELHGSIDGIQLKRFVPGEVYDVSPSFGSYLLTVRAAEAVFIREGQTTSPDSVDDRPRRSGVDD